jgi:hypothetical protein
MEVVIAPVDLATYDLLLEAREDFLLLDHPMSMNP